LAGPVDSRSNLPGDARVGLDSPGGQFAEPDLGLGDRGRFVRVSDSDPRLLRELAELGIRPGDKLEVVAGGVRAGSTMHRLRPALARSMRVEVEP